MIKSVQDDAPEAFEVFEENWDAVRVFVNMATQWNTSFSGVTGLNYQSLMILFELYEIRDRVKVFEDIRLLEITVLNIWNKKD